VKMDTVIEVSTVLSTVTKLKVALERFRFDEINHHATSTNEKEKCGDHNLKSTRPKLAELRKGGHAYPDRHCCTVVHLSSHVTVPTYSRWLKIRHKTEFQFSGEHRSREGPSAPNSVDEALFPG